MTQFQKKTFVLVLLTLAFLSAGICHILSSVYVECDCLYKMLYVNNYWM